MAEKKVIISLFCCIDLFMVQAFKEGRFMTKSFDHTYQNNEHFHEGVLVRFADLNQAAWLRQHSKYSVFCGNDAVKVVLPSGPLSDVEILGMYAV